MQKVFGVPLYIVNGLGCRSSGRNTYRYYSADSLFFPDVPYLNLFQVKDRIAVLHIDVAVDAVIWRTLYDERRETIYLIEKILYLELLQKKG